MKGINIFVSGIGICPLSNFQCSFGQFPVVDFGLVHYG